MRKFVIVLLVLGTAVLPAGLRGDADAPVEILKATVGRYMLVPKLLSPDWFHLDEPRLGTVYLNVPAHTDLNGWLDIFKGKQMTLLLAPGRGYEPLPNERIVRETVVYSLQPVQNQHNFFIGDIDIVVELEPDHPKRFLEQRRLVDRLMPFVDKEVVLIFRPRLG